jgi:hypothetical protein
MHHRAVGEKRHWIGLRQQTRGHRRTPADVDEDAIGGQDLVADRDIVRRREPRVPGVDRAAGQTTQPLLDANPRPL